MIQISGGKIWDEKTAQWMLKNIVMDNGVVHSIDHIMSPAEEVIAKSLGNEGVATAIAAAKKPEILSEHTFNATGMYVLPGGIDMHVHFRVPGGEQKEDWEHATAAAYAGGITYVCDMPNNTPAIISVEALQKKAEMIASTAPDAMAHGLYMAATENNLDEIIAADKAGLICGVKVYYGTSTGDLTMNNIEALEALFRANISVPIVIHAEDDAVIEDRTQEVITENGGVTSDGTKPNVSPEVHSKIRAREAAISALHTIVHLVRETGATNVHITHITTAEEVEMIRAAKKEGLQITCDTTPHHLTFTTDDYAALGNLLRVNPPIREKEDVSALWKGLRDGTIDMVGSDHAPHTLEEKQLNSYWDVPSGVPGVQTLLPVLIHGVITGELSWSRLHQVIGTAPAARFGLNSVDAPRGEVSVGAIADIVCIDPLASTSVQNTEMKSKSAWTPFDKKVLRGAIQATIVKNHIFDYRTTK